MNNFKIIASFIFIVLSFLSCDIKETKPDIAKEKEIIAETVSDCIGWFKDKDFDRLFSIVAKDSNYISVHPTDRVIRGYDTFVKNADIFRNPDFVYVRHELKDLKITLSESGKTAWYYCRLYDINSYKGEPANWENARWTGVLEKRDGKWVIVQQHFSFATE